MLELLNINDFDAVYDIMQQSFPSDEYRPYEEQKSLFDNDEYNIYVQKEDDGNIIAFIAVWDFNSFVYIEHFAVDPSYRNGGVGSSILRDITEIYGDNLCLEVELPNSDVSVRRIGFYKRCGFYYNDYPYIQPSISKGKKEVPLKIMTYGNQIDNKSFNVIKEILYTKVYNVI